MILTTLSVASLAMLCIAIIKRLIQERLLQTSGMFHWSTLKQ